MENRIASTDQTTLTEDSDTGALRRDSNTYRNGAMDDHGASPMLRMSGASSQVKISTLLKSPVSTRHRASVLPVLTIPAVNLTKASGIRVGSTTPKPSQRGINKEKSSVPDALQPGPSNTRDRNSAEPPVKIAKTENRTDVSNRSDCDDEDEKCSICLNRSSTSGEHRLVSLKCGHVFGHSCVKNWLQSKRFKDRKCPNCKAKANLRDLRFLYARRLVSVDKSEIEALQRQLDTTKDEKNRIELQLRQVELLTVKSNVEFDKYNVMYASEIEALKRQLDASKDEKNRVELELRQIKLTAKSNANVDKCNVM